MQMPADIAPTSDGFHQAPAFLRLTAPPGLDPRAALALFGALGIGALTIGLGMFLSGAWPVIGFMGLELLVLLLCFRLFAGKGRWAEEVELLSPHCLRITKYDHRGRARWIELDPKRCQVVTRFPLRWSTAVVLRQPGDYRTPQISVRLAKRLNPDARQKFVMALKDLLKQRDQLAAN